MTTTATAERTEVSPAIIAHDFVEAHHHMLEAEHLDAIVEKLTSVTQKYPATGTSLGVIFYARYTVNVKGSGGKSFEGNGGGIAGIGGGALIGDVYTDDLDRLYRDTVSFEYNSAFAYTSVLFFDKNSQLLGHFQSGSVSTLAGVGGGQGKWS